MMINIRQFHIKGKRLAYINRAPAGMVVDDLLIAKNPLKPIDR